MTEEEVFELEPLWVFGYASLLWNPGFPVAERKLAVLQDYHRSFCMRSIHHRGTSEHPGLVLALDEAEGATCQGLALRVTEGAEGESIAYLRERELISSAYRERIVALGLTGGGQVQALAYIIDPNHDQYVADLALEEQAQIITHAVGGRGPNPEYLWNTAEHLHELGIRDPDLDWLSDRVRALKY